MCIRDRSKGEDHHVEFIVLDRPSSISSGVVEGTMTTPENASGISRYPLPSRYGLTMGELAKLYQGEGYKNYWITGAPGSTANEYGETTSAPANWNWDDPTMEKKISLADCDLTVIPCEGYTRAMYWDCLLYTSAGRTPAGGEPGPGRGGCGGLCAAVRQPHFGSGHASAGGRGV